MLALWLVATTGAMAASPNASPGPTPTPSAGAPSASPSPALSPSPSPSPSPSATPRPATLPPGKKSGPRALVLPGVEVASASFPLDADSMFMHGLVYEGTTTVTLPGGGTQSVLQFSLTSGTITHLSEKLGCGSSRAMETYTNSTGTIALGNVVLDVLEFKTASPAADYTVASPPTATPPQSFADFTATTVQMTVSYFSAGSMSGPLQMRPVTC